MTSFFEDHLGLDAIVAFADGEMSLTAFQRAAAHVSRCASCAAEVAEQTNARQRLRAAACPRIPNGLMDALRSIPVALPVAPPPDGVSRDPVTGRVFRTPAVLDAAAGVADTPFQAPPIRPHGPGGRGRGFRLGAGAVVAGLAVGAIAAAAIADRRPGPAGPAAGPAATQVGAPFAPAPVNVVQVVQRTGR